MTQPDREELAGLDEHALVFARFPDLAAHIERMASAGHVGSLLEWNKFLHTLDAALRHAAALRQSPSVEEVAMTYEDAEKLALKVIHDDGRGMIGRNRNHLHQRVARAILSAHRDALARLYRGSKD